jgi:rhamnosyltransferase
MDATIVIPVKNGGDLLDQVLDRVFSQKTVYQYEVICVDSGSTDRSLEIIKKYPCSLYEISPQDFGHGKTRNYGAGKGTGEFILFLTQDALPVNDVWLENFINAMKLDDAIAGGFGKHLPYPGCNVLDERDLGRHFAGFGQENTIHWLEDRKRYEKEEGYRHFLSFFSDNNSCLRRSIWEQYPYPDVDFSEDQIWMKQMIELGYKRVYCPDAMVYHSHNYPLKTYFKRYYDQYKGIYRIHQYRMFRSIPGMLHGCLGMIKGDLRYIWGRSSHIKRKWHWTGYAVVRDSYQCIAGYIAGGYEGYSDKKKAYLDRHISQQRDQIQR